MVIMTKQPGGCSHRADGGAALRILIDSSDCYGCNIGDTAMLQVALDRLRAFWPRAVVRIHCLDSESVRLLESQVEIINRRLTRPRQRQIATAWSCAALREKRRYRLLIDEYLRAVKSADLVLLSGGGNLNDAFVRYALPRLATLELAKKSGAVTALVGQGIGPMSNPLLRGQAARILPEVDFICLRDGIGSLTLLDEIGVPASRVMVTGDDAIELGYQARVELLGSGIGVNSRIARYSGVDQSVVERIGAIVNEAASPLGASLVPLPISRNTDEDDLRTARLILNDTAELDSHRKALPSVFLRALPECRIVVSGSYHAVVLALSMGIPAVAIAGCDYYVHKFRGLANRFGPGCHVELTSHPDFENRLRAAIDAAWHSAPSARQSLLRTAVRQVAAGKAAYRRLFALVESRIATASWIARHPRAGRALNR
jgi:polysaccharide pyruvyl transferase WcaK-like protein